MFQLPFWHTTYMFLKKVTSYKLLAQRVKEKVDTLIKVSFIFTLKPAFSSSDE